MALPKAHERVDPAFTHHPAATLPVVELGGSRLTVVAGHGFGRCSPVPVFSPTLYVSIQMAAGSELEIPTEHAERALYPVSGEVDLDCGDRCFDLTLNHMAVLEPGTRPRLQARSDTRVMLLGGEPLDGPRAMWWNFVASRRELIEEAKQAWEDGRFPGVPGETEFIPLP